MAHLICHVLRMVCIAVLSLTGECQSAQEQTFRIDVDLVRILASVKDKTGVVIGGLSKEEFKVFYNGVLQELRLFERRTEQPLSVALLIDISGSTGRELRYELTSVRTFLKSLF